MCRKHTVQERGETRPFGSCASRIASRADGADTCVIRNTKPRLSRLHAPAHSSVVTPGTYSVTPAGSVVTRDPRGPAESLRVGCPRAAYFATCLTDRYLLNVNMGKERCRATLF